MIMTKADQLSRILSSLVSLNFPKNTPPAQWCIFHTTTGLRSELLQACVRCACCVFARLGIIRLYLASVCIEIPAGRIITPSRNGT